MDVQGESWNQGDAISGILTIKNHGSASIIPEGVRVELARGHLKKVHAKSPGALEILESKKFPPVEIVPQGEISLPWNFATTRNSPITDTVSSLFLLYGSGDAPGQLQFTSCPFGSSGHSPGLRDRLPFCRKIEKTAKDSIEVKLAPPDAKAIPAVEQLSLNFKFEGDLLELKYGFAVKKVEASAAAVDLKKDKKSSSRLSHLPITERQADDSITTMLRRR